MKTPSKAIDAKEGPRRPLCAYNFFFREYKKRWLSQNKPRKGAASGSRFLEMTRAVSSKWKSLPEEARQVYYQEAAKDKERYLKEVAEVDKAIWEKAERLREDKFKAKIPAADSSTNPSVGNNINPAFRNTVAPRANIPAAPAAIGLPPSMLPRPALFNTTTTAIPLPLLGASSSPQSLLASRLVQGSRGQSGALDLNVLGLTTSSLPQRQQHNTLALNGIQERLLQQELLAQQHPLLYNQTQPIALTSTAESQYLARALLLQRARHLGFSG